MYTKYAVCHEKICFVKLSVFFNPYIYLSRFITPKKSRQFVSKFSNPFLSKILYVKLRNN